MRNSYKGAALFLVIVMLGFKIGSHLLQSCFFGVVTLIGLIVLVESISPLKWVLSRSTRMFDVIIFVFTILATMNYGLTIAASLVVAGLGYTLFYGPYLREGRVEKKTQKKETGNIKNNYGL